MNCLNNFDGVFTVTQNDLNIYKEEGCLVPIEFIPTSVDVTKNQKVDTAVEFPSIFHIGAMDWIPNKEGLLWFINNVWGKIIEEYPDVKFYIAGRGDSSWLDIKKYKNIELLGEIDDAATFIQSKAIMIVPLFSGSGMRVKIIEGMTLGKAIVSTSIGVEGIIHKNNENIIIADSVNLFIDGVLSLIRNRENYNRLCLNAKDNALSNYDNSVLTEKLLHFYSTLIK